MLSWSAAVVYGAAGGLVVELVTMWRQLLRWQQARHEAMSRGKPRPGIKNYVDPGPDALVALTRAALGCVAGLCLRTEVTGIYAALTVGASAPAVLAYLGKAATLPQVPTAEAQVPEAEAWSAEAVP
jgi:hypothetical protein